MKKLLALLLALCTLLSCMMISVYADEEPAEGTEEGDGLAHETYTFRVFEESEEPFLAFTNAGNNGTQRFSDTTTQTVYHYTIKNIYSIEKINWHAKVGAQLLLQFSQKCDVENYNESEWTTFYAFEWTEDMAQDKGLDFKEYDYDLTELFDPAKGNNIYIRIGDVTTDNGWGGSIFKDADNILDITYKPLSAEELDKYETAPTEDSISLHGMNQAFGKFEVDTENQRAGSACLTHTIDKQMVCETKFETPVDGTGFDTLEFDWYISDLALLDKFQGEGCNSGVEITSAGKCDHEEVSWKIPDLVAKNVNGELKEGWNHVVLYIADGNPDNRDGSGPLRMEAINFIRIFMVGEKEPVNITVKYDNFRLTKAYAAAVEAAKAEAAPIIEAAQALIDSIKNGVNADNFDSVKKAYNSYSRKAEKLDDLVMAQVGTDITKGVRDVKKALDAYEKSLEETAAPETDAPGTEAGNNETQAPGEDEKTSNIGLIIGIVAAVVVIAAVLFFVLKGKKKK